MEEKKKSFEALVIEARARLTWGDPPGKISAWLREEGLPEETIQQVQAFCAKERAVHVRSTGFREMAYGGGLILLGGLGFAFQAWAGYFSGKFSALSAAPIVWGLYRFFRGLIWFCEGGNYQGDLSDMGE